jgi:hypothetical protein
VTAKVGGIRPFILTPAQRIVLDVRKRLALEGRPVRMKVLKARQQGLSTICCALQQQGVQTHPGRNAISVADKLSLPRNWLRRAKRWYQMTPKRFRPHLAVSNSIELYYDMFDSHYWIGSQAGQTPGMGETIHDVHCSELAFWADPAAIMADLLPAVPKDDPTATVMFESTGQLEGDWWHTQCLMSRDGEDGYAMIFLPWFITQEYTMTEDAYIKLYGEPMGDLQDDELELVELGKRWIAENPGYADMAGFTGITEGHIRWRRFVVKDEFSGDVDMFRSRYPACFEDAFLETSSLALPLGLLQKHASMVRPAEQFLRLRKGEQFQTHDADPFGWKIWKEPEEYSEYAIGCDVATGELSDRTDARSNRDFSAIAVMDRRTREFVATFHAQLQVDHLADQLLEAAKWYNNAWLAPEVEGPGLAVIASIKSYPNIMARTSTPDSDKERVLSKLGWHTGGKTRDILIEDWIREGQVQGHLVVRDERLVQEERTFVVSKTGKREHRAGCHDDLLFAHMIAYQVHKNCPHNRKSHLGPMTERSTRPSWAYDGGVDMDEPKEEECEVAA